MSPTTRVLGTELQSLDEQPGISPSKPFLQSLTLLLNLGAPKSTGPCLSVQALL